MHEDIERLITLKNDIWECRQYQSRFGPHTICHVTRRLTSEERKFIYRTIIKHQLIVVLYTAGNQGVGMALRLPEASFGNAMFPGISFCETDSTAIINLWEDHFFDDKPITYTFRTWCRAHGTNAVDRAYKFFRAFADLPHNLPLMERYNFRKPYIIPSRECHY